MPDGVFAVAQGQGRPGEKRHGDELINVRARLFTAVGRGAVRPPVKPEDPVVAR